ncbi:MAG: CAP domain-containing protein [Sandaracinus sp.]
MRTRASSITVLSLSLLVGGAGCSNGSTPPPSDGGSSGACMMGSALTEPIPGCMPVTAASTGDPHQDCVNRINQFRCECQHLPPLARWTDGEACADQMAQYDHDHPGSPHQAFRDGICTGGNAQNECPGWPSVPATVDGCLQQMWDEGPGTDFNAHGHYINMTNSRYTMVACGFYSGSGGVYAVQNFR